MTEREIDTLLEAGWWIQVSPVSLIDSKGWTCGVYKQFKKSKNWVTEYVKSFSTPHECYEWANEVIKKQTK